eukprot:TRINITY_DN11781_c0_g1_i4.p2 TRINITY_DN11781_c0_g1~~TRINITY_DN11781_c0_g1_i4.p2  ORF type:complete len:416 (+),score=75.01 TRINITY_DN11781_c0_g1_i4:1259-2506(+)
MAGVTRSTLKKRKSHYQTVLLPPSARRRQDTIDILNDCGIKPAEEANATELTTYIGSKPSLKSSTVTPTRRRRRRFRRQDPLQTLRRRSSVVNGTVHAERQALLKAKHTRKLSLRDLTWREAVFITLDRNSKSLPSRWYKYTMLAVILFNVAVFLAASDERLSSRHPHFFDTVEGVTSTLFLLEYCLRAWSVVEDARLRKRFGEHLWLLRLRHTISMPAIIDALSTFPWFVEQIAQAVQSSFAVPMTTALRTLLLFRILKTEKFTRSFSSLHRVVRANDEVLVSGVCVCLVLLLFTATLLFYAQPGAYTSIPDAMYTAGLMLAGQGVPEGDLTPATKFLVLCTAFISIGIFAVPAAMLAWGFEAEAERLKERQDEIDRQRANGISVEDWVIYEDSSSDDDDDGDDSQDADDETDE